MASIVPTSSPTCDFVEMLPKSRKSRWKLWGFNVLRFWQRMQVSYYGGNYSIQRGLAFEEYCRKTPLSRVLLVCFATPLPMVALVFGQEVIPLQELSAGWSANYGMWIRAAVLVGIVTHALLIQATYLIDEFALSTQDMLKLYVILPVCVVTLSMAVSALVVFPIPFYVMFVTPPFYLLLIISIRVVVGADTFQQMLANHIQVGRCVRFVCAQTSTVFIFPVYEMLFHAAEGTKYELPVILLLPVLKVALKNLVLHFAKVLEDMAPVEVIFTADFFNAIYVSTCMQSSTSIAAIAAITITDLSQTATMLYGLHRRTATILFRLHQTVNKSSKDDNNMLTLMSWLCKNPESFKAQSYSGVRRRSCHPHQLSPESKRVLDTLDQTSVCSPMGAHTSNIPPQNVLSAPQNHQLMHTHKSKSSIHPIVPGSTRALFPQSRSMKRSTILLESSQVLFTTECLVLTAFLEAFMPLFYCSYMVLMVYLPNARYHTEIKGVNRENIVSTVLPLVVFGLLQILSFLLLMAVIKRNCGMQTLYQLAFVLEAQRSLVQCKMMLWMVITLCFRVTHFGVDFKFEFVRLGFPRVWAPQG